ncbi:MAG: hypothetical protein QW275_02565, partial [Candidatus Anstonellaceae archaeon]
GGLINPDLTTAPQAQGQQLQPTAIRPNPSSNPDAIKPSQGGPSAAASPQDARKEFAADVLDARYRYTECQIDFSSKFLSQIASSSPEASSLELHIQNLYQSREMMRTAANLGDEQAFASAVKQARQTIQEANQEVAKVAAKIGKEKTAELRQTYVALKQQMAECRNEAMFALGNKKLDYYVEEAAPQGGKASASTGKKPVEEIRKSIASGNPEMLRETLSSKCLGGVCTSKEKYYENVKEQTARLQAILDKLKGKAESQDLSKAQAKIDEANSIISKSSSYDEETAQKIKANLAEAASLMKQAALKVSAGQKSR